MSDTDQEQLERELEEQLKSLRIEDILVQSLVTASAIGFRRLGLSEDTRQDRDLGQSQAAIEVMEALVPVLEKLLPEDLVASLRSSTTELKLAYVRAVSETAGGGPDEKE